MKYRKLAIHLDLLIQSILLLLIVIFPFTSGGLFKAMVFFAIIGGWQVISSIIWSWTLKDSKRYVYLIIIITLYAILLPIITTYSPDLLNSFSIVYNVFNPILIGIWYYIITWQDFIKIKKTI